MRAPITMRGCAGSVRVPASYCGILGLRPTLGRVSMEATCALAPSYDTGADAAVPLLLERKEGVGL